MKLFFFLFLSLTCASAHGQATGGELPDPIATDDLARWAARLDLSAAQIAALDRAHAEYLTAFAELREGEIAAHLEAHRDLTRSIFVNTDGRDALEGLSGARRLVARIRSLDDALFASLDGLLTDEQVERLNRVRDARERTRCSTGLVRLVTLEEPATRADLAEIAERAQLEAADRQAIDPLLAAYETQLTTLLRRLFDSMHELFAEVIREVDASDPAPMGNRFRAMNAARIERGGRVVETAGAITALNRTTLSRLEEALSDDGRRRLRQRFLAEAYPRASLTGNAAIERFAVALEIDLDEATRAAVADALASLEARLERLTDRMLDLIDSHRRDALASGADGIHPDAGAVDALAAEAQIAANEAMVWLAEILGPERMRALAIQGRQHGGAEMGGSAAFRRPASFRIAESRTPMQLVRYGSDSFLSPPISSEEQSLYVRMLGLDRDDVAVVQALHAAYLERFAEVASPLVASLSAPAQPPSGQPASTPAVPTPARVASLWSARKRASETIAGLDEEYFRNLEGAFAVDDASKRALMEIRRMRERARWNRPPFHQFAPVEGDAWRAAHLDLVELFATIDVDAETRRATESPLAAYGDELGARFSSRWNHAFELSRSLDDLGVRSKSGDLRDAAAEQHRLIQEGSTRIRAINRQVEELNRTTVDRLEAIASPAAAIVVRDAFLRAAHPTVFRDPAAAGPLFDAALALDDLTTEQRQALADGAVEYRSAYALVCREMTDLDRAANAESAPAAGSGAPAPSPHERRRDMQQRMERLGFEREELSNRAWRRVIAILTDVQRRRLGIATEP